MVAKFESMSNQLNKAGPLSEGTEVSKVERSGIEGKVSDNSENEDL